MSNLQTFTDKMAISLSLLCALHCLAFPIAIVMLPSLAALPLNDEAFHLWMVLVVIPTSIYALSVGCKKHKRYRVLGLGVIGLIILASAVFIPEAYMTELGEKVLTLVGACIISVGHCWNYKLCQLQKKCNY